MSHQFNVRSSVLYKNRYCDQNKFDVIIIYEGNDSKDSTNSITQIESVDVKCNIVLITMSANHCYVKTAAVGSDMFVFVRSDKILRKTSCVDIRSRSTWKNLTIIPDSRINFSVCSFMKSIYLIGGYLSGDICLKMCYKYEIDVNKWTKIADLNIDRCKSSCAVFEGKIVATGGYRYSGRTKSAESYDYHENKWIHLPDMIGLRDEHSSFNMGNKFFVIGGYSNVEAEVFDSTSRKFTLLNLKILCRNEYLCKCETVNVCREMFVFCSCYENRQLKLHVYNVDEKRLVSEEIIKIDQKTEVIIHKVPKQ